MQLQLNAGNLLNLSYIQVSDNVFQNLTDSGTLSLGPFQIHKKSPQSFLNILLDFNFNLTIDPQGFFTNITIKLIRNRNSSEPILQNLYAVSPDNPNLNTHIEYLDKAFPPGTSIKGSPIEYLVEIDYELLPNITGAFSINSIIFSEQSIVKKLTPQILII